MGITIVTSCQDYGQYLEDWANSIAGQTVLPRAVAILDNGSLDSTPEQIPKVHRILGEKGIPVTSTRVDRSDLGWARNRAVSMSSTPWVMHLDADDMMMPHCIEDVLELAPTADVVALGYERCGDLKAGPVNRVRLYSDTQGQSTLDSTAPASGVSPFRRLFWERSPYREDMKGGWDTALWIGFAHLQARFRATKRPCFWYRQHRDSVFNVRRINDMRTEEVGTKLQSLRRGDKGVSIIIPWRPDNGPRDRSYKWISKHWKELFPDWEVIPSTLEHGDWRKGRAINRGVDRARGDVLIVADADCLVSPSALKHAVSLVRNGAPWVVPHTLVKRLDEESTERILRTRPGSVRFRFPGSTLVRNPYQGFAGGGIFVVERAKFDFVKGFPEEFVGWGSEDEAMAVILDTLLGSHFRFAYDLWHLWHPSLAIAGSNGRNRQFLRRYEMAKGRPDTMWNMIKNRPKAPAKFIDTFPYQRTQRDFEKAQLAATGTRSRSNR